MEEWVLYFGVKMLVCGGEVVRNVVELPEKERKEGEWNVGILEESVIVEYMTNMMSKY